MFAIRRLVDEDKLRLKIQANKKKPVKKSKFQQRLEEMAKTKRIGTKKKINREAGQRVRFFFICRISCQFETVQKVFTTLVC